MRRQGDRDAGFTLVELLMAMTLSVIIVGTLVTALQLTFKTATGLSSSSTTSDVQDKDLVLQQVAANAGVQEFSRVFTADVENTSRASGIKTTALGSVPCAVTGGDPTLGSDVALLRLSPASGASGTIDYRYSRDAVHQHAQITRYTCPSAGTGSAQIVSTGLSSTSTPSPATVTAASGPRTVTLRFSTLTGRLYTFSATQRLDLDTEPAPPSGVVVPVPLPDAVLAMNMVDGTSNGRPDAVLVTLASNAASCATGWVLTGIPAGGTQGVSSAVGGTTVKVAINEGPLLYDTAVGALRVSFTPPTGCSVNAISVGQKPIDASPPVLVGLTPGGQPLLGTAGRMEQGDSVTLQFSEQIDTASVPKTVSVAETGGKKATGGSPGQSDTLQITGTGSWAGKDLSLLSTLGAFGDYVDATDKTASHTAAVTPNDGANHAGWTITLNSSCSGAGSVCSKVGAGEGTFTFLPATTLLGTDGLTPVTSATSPQPGAAWRMF